MSKGAKVFPTVGQVRFVTYTVTATLAVGVAAVWTALYVRSR